MHGYYGYLGAGIGLVAFDKAPKYFEMAEHQRGWMLGECAYW